MERLFFSSSEDFTAEPRTSWLNSIKNMFYQSSKTLIIIVVLIMGTVQADALSFGYVALSVIFWYLDEYVSREGNRVWR